MRDIAWDTEWAQNALHDVGASAGHRRGARVVRYAVHLVGVHMVAHVGHRVQAHAEIRQCTIVRYSGATPAKPAGRNSCLLSLFQRTPLDVRVFTRLESKHFTRNACLHR